MSQGTLVDLYVSAAVGSTTEAWQAAMEAGLDGLVYVVDHADDVSAVLEAASQLEKEGPTRLMAGLSLRSSEGLRLVALAPQEPRGPAPTSGATASEIQAQSIAWGGFVLPVCPRHDDDGYPLQEAPAATVTAPGWVVLTPQGSLLGRDLALENCVGGGHIILGATGPFGSLEDIGRISTWLAADPQRPATWLEALSLGASIAVERERQEERKQKADQANAGGPKKKRRRKRRKRRPEEDSDHQSDPTTSAEPSTESEPDAT